jgi:hypothetical protein
VRPALSAQLLAAYEGADYVVLTKPELVLRIGEPSPRLDALLEGAGAGTAAFLTAANPNSEARSAKENAPGIAALDGMVAAAGYPRQRAEGRDPAGRWPAEPALLVLGIYLANAQALGRLFGQNAIVFIEKGGAPKLIILAHA